MNEIVILRLVTGEQLIGKLIARENNVLKLVKPCIMEAHPNGVAVIRWPVMANENEEEVEVKEEHVVVVVKPEEQVANHYNTKFGSGLVTISQKLQL